MAFQWNLQAVTNTALYNIKKYVQFINMPSLSGVRLEVYSYEELLESKISTQMIIASKDSSKQIISDNIAPMPRTWNIGAYIGSGNVASTLNLLPPGKNANIDPSVVSIGNAVASTLINSSLQAFNIPTNYEVSIFFMPSLKLQKDVLYNAWLNNKLIWFVDKYKTYIPVAIEKLSFISDPTVQNKIPVQISLKEVIMYNGYNTQVTDQSKNMSLLGTTFSPDLTSPATSYVNMGTGSSTLLGQSSGLFGGNVLAAQR
jgi:hypothetical protein